MQANTMNNLNNAASSLRNQASKTQSEDGEMGKQDFMNLFLTQMSNQSPTDPMDSGAMMSQLAQLGSMEQMENMNKQMQSLNKTQGQIAQMSSLDFIGKDVMAEADGLQMMQGNAKPVYYNLDQEAKDIRVTVESLDGQTVFQENQGMQQAGKQQFIWDGKSSEGHLMPDGKYNIRLRASFADGSNGDLSTYNSGRVSKVEYKDGQTWVRTRNQYMPMSKIHSVDTASVRQFGGANPMPLMNELAPKSLNRDTAAIEAQIKKLKTQ